MPRLALPANLVERLVIVDWASEENLLDMVRRCKLSPFVP
jgi:hypothetical protein